MEDDRAKKAVAITPHATNPLPNGPTSFGIGVTTAGAYNIVLENDTAVVSMNLAAGVIHRLAVKRVVTGGISETGIVGFYLQ